MSEKRFRFEKECTEDFFSEKGVFYNNGRPMGANEIIALLNSLSEENEQLKKRNKFLEEFDGRAKTVANVMEENEQLKQQREIEKKWQLEKDKYYVKIKKENEQLRKELYDCEKFRYSVFKGMEKIIEEKKNDNGGFQVWEVPPIPKGKRISFTTNNGGD